MKLIHCADLHLDSKMQSNLSKEQAKERRAEILRTFVRMVDYAEQNEVFGIMIAGDMFDTRAVSATTRNIVKSAIEKHPQIQFFYLKGNHDLDSFVSKLEEIPENLHLFTDEWTSYRYPGVTITGMEMTPENHSSMYHSLVLDHDCYNIVLLHGQIENYQSGNPESISRVDLANKNIDYLALGHVHTMQTDRIDRRGMYAYPGCLEGRGFDECGEKGFILLNIDENSQTAEYSFVAIAERNLYEIEVDVTGATGSDQIAQLMEEAISREQYPAKSMVKFILKGELSVECEINLDYLTEMFEEYFYCIRIKDETTLLISYEDYAKDESLKGEFVRTVMCSNMAENEKAEVIRCGILALSGEDF